MGQTRDRGRPARVPTIHQALDSIEKRIEPVYVFHGANTPLIEQALGKLRVAIVGQGDDAFGAYQVFRGDEDKAVQVVSAARTLPMLVERQLIVVRKADALPADDHPVLLKYLEKPNPSTTLVLVATKINKSRKLWRIAAEKKLVYEAPSLTERGLARHLQERAPKHDIELDAEASHLLADLLGPDANAIEDALERLSLYVGPGQRATARDVEAVVTASKVHSVFELTDALGRRDVEAALRTLDNMLENREAPLRILATLATHMRRMLHTAEVEEKLGGNAALIASEVGVPPFLVDKYRRQMPHFGRTPARRRRMLRAVLRRIAAAEIALKSARRSERLVLEEMVFALCLGRPRVDRAHRRRASTAS